MDNEFDKELKKILRKSRELTRQSEALVAGSQELMRQTKMILQQIRRKKVSAAKNKRNKLGGT